MHGRLAVEFCLASLELTSSSRSNECVVYVCVFTDVL